MTVNVNNPFEMLGIRPTTDAEAVRRAYRAMAMKIHPDHFQDPEQQRVAQEQMVALNSAYEHALRLAGTHTSPLVQTLTSQEAVRMAERLMAQGNPESALRQLMRSETRDADWYNAQGQVLMALDQYDSAHQSFREAVRRDPDNMVYRSGALDAAVAMKKSRTLGGKLKQFFKPKRK